MRKKRKRKHPVRKFFMSLLALLLCMLFAVCAFYGAQGFQMYQEAIEEKPISGRVEVIRSMEGFTPYSELPECYIDATISVEDHRFETHVGIDPIAIARAAWADIRAMSFVEGGSTITQQLVKNLLFTQDKKIERKAAEVFAALEMEKEYTKEEIFELYANTVYFGSGYYGIGQASRGYFEKAPSELSDYECVMLAGIPNAPLIYSPDSNAELAEQRMSHVLDSMVRNHIITQEEAEQIKSGNNIYTVREH